MNHLFYFSTEDAEHIFEAATAKNLTGPGYAWIVTEQALNAVNVPLGRFISHRIYMYTYIVAGHLACRTRFCSF